MNRSAQFALAALLAIPFVAFAGGAKSAACMPTVRDAWVRMTPMMPMGAGFFVLDNRCKAPFVLTGATSKMFGDVSMHETRVEGGVSRMRPLPRVDVAPGAQVAFAPGGRHLMMMSPTGELGAGRKVRVELKFADGRVLPVDFDVRSAAP
ncbi:copper chaperone PCu(A)C [Lysobacter sp. HA35]